MKKTKIIAFWDLVFTVFLSAIGIQVFLYLTRDNKVTDLPWYQTLICASCYALPVGTMWGLQRITIDLSCDKVRLFYLVNLKKNDKDIFSNWVIYPSQIESIEVVKLSKAEKRQYTSAKFLFNKYLKVQLKHGHVKYVYVSHYSKFQIKRIVKLLTKNIFSKELFGRENF